MLTEITRDFIVTPVSKWDFKNGVFTQTVSNLPFENGFTFPSKILLYTEEKSPLFFWKKFSEYKDEDASEIESVYYEPSPITKNKRSDIDRLIIFNS